MIKNSIAITSSSQLQMQNLKSFSIFALQNIGYGILEAQFGLCLLLALSNI
jgi:hypothetical protein